MHAWLPLATQTDGDWPIRGLAACGQQPRAKAADACGRCLPPGPQQLVQARLTGQVVATANDQDVVVVLLLDPGVVVGGLR